MSKRTATRRRELQTVLDVIRESQPISRADLARILKVNRGTITALVNELLADEAIVEGRTIDAPRGRRPTMLFLRKHDPLVIAVDVRPHTSHLMLSDLSGKEIAAESFAVSRSPVALVDHIAARVRQLAQTHIAEGAVRSIGVVVPGIVDHSSGRVLNAPQLGWRDFDIRAALAEAAGLPVSIESTPAACARLHRYDNFVYLLVSDTVSGAIVSGKQIVRGANSAAGEFGHLPIDRRGPRCICGARGCLNAFTSNFATLSRYPRNGVSIEELIARAAAGDEHARNTIARTARYLATGIAMIVNALNPARIIIGGEIVDAWDLVAPVISSALRRRTLISVAAHTPVVPDRTARLRLRAASALALGSLTRPGTPERVK